MNQDITEPKVAKFVQKSFEINQQYSKIIQWLPTGKEFIIKDTKLFQSAILPLHFKRGNISSFCRQLNAYGFNRTTKGQIRNIFQHPYFIKGKPELLKDIKIIKKKQQGQLSSSQDIQLEIYQYQQRKKKIAQKKQEGQDTSGAIDMLKKCKLSKSQEFAPQSLKIQQLPKIKKELFLKKPNQIESQTENRAYEGYKIPVKSMDQKYQIHKQNRKNSKTPNQNLKTSKSLSNIKKKKELNQIKRKRPCNLPLRVQRQWEQDRKRKWYNLNSLQMQQAQKSMEKRMVNKKKNQKMLNRSVKNPFFKDEKRN